MSEPFTPARPFGTSDASSSTMSAFLPILILALVMLAWFVFQISLLRGERDLMRQSIDTQEKQVQDSQKLRTAFEGVMSGTQQLADGGNPNAKLIVEELKKHGITYTPSPATGGAASVPAAPAK